MKIPKLEKSSYYILTFLFLFFFISMIAWIVKFPGVRRSFVFKASDSKKFRLETRFVPVITPQNKYCYYINELLEGPISEHCTKIFASGTTLINCFKKGDTLFVTLSKEVFHSDASTTDYNFQIELFKKNIYKNFPNIKNIELFIEGTSQFQAEMQKNN